MNNSVTVENKLVDLKAILPEKRILMGPGPSNVSARVLAASAMATIGHLDPAFLALMEEIKTGLRYAFQTKNTLTFPVSAPGSAGMETCFTNLVEKGDKVIVAHNGVFGKRMCENVERLGGELVEVAFAWGEAVEPAKVEQALTAHPDAKILAFVHAETSTGVLSDAAALCALAAKHDCLSLVDTVTSLGGVPVNVDAWGADAVYSGTQKCLSSMPGISPVSFSSKAAAVIKARKTPVASWFLDLSLVMNYWEAGAGGARVYHHTAPVNAMYGLYESLRSLQEEGLTAAHARHAHMHIGLTAGLKALGLTLPVAAQIRLPQLNVVSIPEGIKDTDIRRYLLKNFNLEIGAGLGPYAGKTWRIGLMGNSATRENVTLCLAALGDALNTHGFKCDTGKALSAALTALKYSETNE